MTDRGTRVRWTTAALVAPAAAAVFTGTTVWAAEHEPATASTTTTSTTPTSTAPPAAASAAAAPAQPDPVVASLQAAVDANTVQVERLRQTVATLQAQAALIAQGTPAAAVRTSKATTRTTSRPTSTTTSRSSSTTRTTPRAPAPAPKPAPVAAPAPAPAPATHTTTGASGAVK